MHYRWMPLVLTLCCAAPAVGLTPRLVKDINPVPTGEWSDPDFQLSSGSFALIYFVAHDGETGRELWRSDGTEAGTFQVLDACPGECSGSPWGVARSGDLFFFRASDAAGRESLWATKGTPVTTFRVLEEPARLVLRRNVWIASAGALFFPATDPDHGLELWRTDGTAAGTFRVTDLRPGPAGSDPDELTEFNGRLFFRADDGRGPSLWTSDGTVGGTRLVRDPVPTTASHAGPAFLRAAGKNLFFTAPSPRGGVGQLWKSDGTTRGTAALTSLKPLISPNPLAPSTGTILDVTVLGSRLFFIAETTAGQELWVSDGTPKGTRALTAFTPVQPFVLFVGGKPAFPSTAFSDRIFFRVNDGEHGVELWTSDGTPRGTRMVKDVCPGSCSGAEGGMAVGRKWFFTAINGSQGNGREVWVTDGSAAGTRLLRDICPGVCSSLPGGFFALGDRVFFLAAPNDTIGHQLWRSDGTLRGTVRLTEGPERPMFWAGPFFRGAIGNVLVFTAFDWRHGQELWRSDGTPRGTRLLADIRQRDVGGSFPDNFSAAGGHLYFSAKDGERLGLWRSDGTEAGTSFVHELVPENFGTTIRRIHDSAAAGNRLVFYSDLEDPGPRLRLWGTDGTSAGTVLLPPDHVFPQSKLLRVGNSVFFAARDPVHGDELWVTDGTPEGTRILELTPGELGSEIKDLTAYKGRLYFWASGDHQGTTLWTSDGTINGTFPVVAPGSLQPEPGFLVEHAGRLWFFVLNEHPEQRLWSTDGTAAGTAPAIKFPIGFGSFFPGLLFSAGSRLFFSGTLGAESVGLWVTDGTTTGTHQVNSPGVPRNRVIAFNESLYHVGWSDSTLWKTDSTGSSEFRDEEGRLIELPSGVFVSFYSPFHVLAGRLYFVDKDGSLYQSDGTEAGTSVIFENVGPEILSAGGRLFFSHHDPATGNELWVLE